ncbi:CRISPR-associated endonuclease Cas3'' [Streptacidiphilus cavernicola]|uniref:CRISPR-associated endonuclease Cas3 n=1 Tax=Streptacidiphilus cavernicola TaxID=3342716 RepID=A0ABV6VVF8_9ACTN
MLEWDGCGEDVSPWGKAGTQRPVTAYPLLFHLLDTAIVVQELWDRFLASNQRACIAAGLGISEAEARVVVAFWAGLHDLGKLTPGFQQCVAEAYTGLSKVLRDDVGEVDGMRHDRASMHTVLGPLSDLGYAADANKDPGVRAAQILGGHHGRFQPMDLARLQQLARSGVDDGLGGAQWRQLRKDYVGAVHGLLGVPVVPQRMTAPSAVLITGLVILADWLVSQEHYWRPWAGGQMIGAAEHFARACVAAPGLVADAGLVRVGLSRKGFTQVHGIERPNPLQASIMEELPEAVAGSGAGILVVTAATGDGKTETALEAERILAQAAGTSGLCFVLPTMATSDEMYKRVAAVVAAQMRPDAGAAVTLTHSMAWLNTAYSDEDLAVAGDDVVSDEESTPDGGVRATLPGRWLRGAKRPLLAQFAVGTIDQSLLGVLPVRHNALRLLALSGKTFVVDEAHAYDPYMQVLLCRLLQWLGSYNCPVVLLSATLPSSVGERLVRAYLEGGKQVGTTALGQMPFRPPYPGWLFVNASGRSTAISQRRQEEQSAERRYRLRVDVRLVRHLPEPRDGGALPGDARLAVLEEVLDPLVAGGGCAAVVCTTVADAQETYAFLRHRFALKAGEEIVLLHARFPGDQREQVTRTVVEALGRIGRRPERMVVESVRVLGCYQQLDGRTTLDPRGEHPLPQPKAGRFSAADVRAVMRRTLPVRAGLFKARTAEQDAPVSWRDHPLLSDLLLLAHPVVGSKAEGVRIGAAVFRLDPELGLVHLRD